MHPYHIPVSDNYTYYVNRFRTTSWPTTQLWKKLWKRVQKIPLDTTTASGTISTRKETLCQIKPTCPARDHRPPPGSAAITRAAVTRGGSAKPRPP